eukprot:5311654-Amphidinium_carterae.1
MARRDIQSRVKLRQCSAIAFQGLFFCALQSRRSTSEAMPQLPEDAIDLYHGTRSQLAFPWQGRFSDQSL